MSGTKIRLSFLFIFIFLAACAPPPVPNHVNNVCHIFRQYPKWYWASLKSKNRWQVPVNVQMAIMHQESHFKGNAKPPRRKLLWFIPWLRPTTSFGYSQAKSATWENYQRSVGRQYARRDKFDDAADFVGWYAHQAHRKLGIKLDDAYRLYLAYHEGLGGYRQRSYLKKPWLISIAHKVSARSLSYQQQLTRCQASLSKKPWYRLW